MHEISIYCRKELWKVVPGSFIDFLETEQCLAISGHIDLVICPLLCVGSTFIP